MSRAITAFGKAAAHYDSHAALQHQIRAQALRHLAGHMPKDARLLDLGCGTGALMAQLSEKEQGWEVIGCDAAFSMAEKAGRASEIAVCARMEQLPFKDNAVDGIISSMALQWADSAVALQEAARILKPGGYIMIALPVTGTLDALQAAFAEVDEARHILSFYDEETLIDEAYHAGLQPVRMQLSRIITQHENALKLMRSLQAIGASHASERRSMLTPRQLKRVMESYKALAGDSAYWRIFFCLLQKPL